MRTSLAFIVALMLCFAATSLHGQGKLGIEFRAGPSFASTELGDAELKTGLGFEAMIDYRFTRYLGAYAGWGWNQFGADRSFAGNDVQFEETGYLLGLQLSSTGQSSLGFYGRVGAILNHLEVENDSGDIIADSKHGLGFRLEAGLDIELGNNWFLRPGIKYQELSRKLTIEEITTDAKLKYINVGLGLAKRF